MDKKKAESNQTNQIKRKIELILNRGGIQNAQSSRSPDKMGIYGMGIYNSQKNLKPQPRGSSNLPLIYSKPDFKSAPMRRKNRKVPNIY